jgi:hypothetical protein
MERLKLNKNNELKALNKAQKKKQPQMRRNNRRRKYTFARNFQCRSQRVSSAGHCPGMAEEPEQLTSPILPIISTNKV